MRKKLLIIALLLISIGYVNAQTALIKVKVTDENNLNLPGAVVAIKSTKITATTDATGTALLYKVPIGKQQIEVAYIGYTTVTKVVELAATTVEVNISLQSGVSVLKGVVVLGDRLKGQAKALNQQKNSGNLVNIISAD
jgi:hypothetical protein